MDVSFEFEPEQREALATAMRRWADRIPDVPCLLIAGSRVLRPHEIVEEFVGYSQGEAATQTGDGRVIDQMFRLAAEQDGFATLLQSFNKSGTRDG